MRFVDTGEPVVLAFPTPIFRHCWPEAEATAVNEALKAAILARREQACSSALSNVGGWQSEPDLMDWQVPELERLSQWIHQAFGSIMGRELGTTDFKSRYVVTGWANINEYGDYNRTHIHSNHHWSGVYYVDIGNPDQSVGPNGAIEFIDPRPAVGVFDFPGITATGTWTLLPEPGLMLLFPSWLRHSVLPYFGEKPRITIAFNLRVGELSLNEEAVGG
jgi:uncharacterized protein (TIGR02466 family)